MFATAKSKPTSRSFTSSTGTLACAGFAIVNAPGIIRVSPSETAQARVPVLLNRPKIQDLHLYRSPLKRI
jgi:hypothetical protein